MGHNIAVLVHLKINAVIVGFFILLISPESCLLYQKKQSVAEAEDKAGGGMGKEKWN